MSRPLIREIPLSRIRSTFYVRYKPDEERIQDFALLMENGTEFPPLLVARNTLELIDGRHRLGAYELLDIKSCSCQLVDVDSFVDMVCMALKMNHGGPLPTSLRDLSVTIEMMLDNGIKKEEIVENLSPMFDEKIVSRQYKDIISKKNKQRKRAAADDVVKGVLTLEQAAKKHRVGIKSLQKEVDRITTKPASICASIDAQTTKFFRSASRTNGHRMASILAAYDEGLINREDADELISHVELGVIQIGKRVADWRARFESRAPHKK